MTWTHFNNPKGDLRTVGEKPVGTDGRQITPETSWIRSHLLLLLNEDTIYFRSLCILKSGFLVRKSEEEKKVEGRNGRIA